MSEQRTVVSAALAEPTGSVLASAWHRAPTTLYRPRLAVRRRPLFHAATVGYNAGVTLVARLSDHWGRGVGFCGLCDNVDCVQEGCIGKRQRLLSGGWKVENVRFAPTAGRRGNACPRGSENVSGGCRPTCARNAPDTLTQEGCRDKA